MYRSWLGRLHAIFKPNGRLKMKLSCKHGDRVIAIKSSPNKT